MTRFFIDGGAWAVPRMVPIVFLVLLVGCGYHGCMSQADMYSDEVREIVYANPSKDSEGNVQAWTKVDFPVEGKKIKLSVEPHGLNFCDKSEMNGQILHIPDSAQLRRDSNNTVHKVSLVYPDKISKGETLTFTLDPIKQFVIDETICRNQHEDIRVTDIDNCLSYYLGQTHSVYYSHKLAKANGGFTNSWYVKTEDGDMPFIVDDIAPVLLSTRGKHIDIDAAVGSSASYQEKQQWLYNKSVDNSIPLAELCWSRSDIRDKVKKEGKSGNGEFEKSVVKFSFEAREQRQKLRDLLDEQSLNVLCGKLCAQNGMRRAHDIQQNKSCSGVHLITPKKKKNSSIPFVSLEGFTPKEYKDEAENKPRENKETKLPEGLPEGERPKKPEEHSASMDEYSQEFKDVALLELGTPYEYKGENHKELIELKISLEKESEVFHLTGARSIVGSYSISIKKDCSAHIDKSLYYKFSEVPLRGEGDWTGSEKIEFLKGKPIEIDATGKKGHLYIGVKDNGDGYDNNVGFYEVRSRISKAPPKVFSVITKWTEDKVRQALYGTNNDNSVVRKLYESISKNGTFTNMVNALLVLYVIVSCLYFILGFSRASVYQLVIIVSKVIVVMFVLRPDSWTFFNDHLLNLFINAPKFLIGAMTGGTEDFGFMDNVLYRFSISQTWIQLLALVFAGPVGWLSVVLIFWGIVVLVQFLFQAIVIYLISIMTIALLLCIAPYFLICILFKRTKNIFDMWIKTLLQTAMQPVVIFACIALLVTAINDVIYAMLNFEVCDACVFKADLKITTVCLLSFPLPIGVIPMVPINDTIRELYNTGETVVLGLPGPMANILIFLALVHAARDFVLNSGEMCSIMFGVFTNLSEVGSTAAQSLLSVVGMDRATGQMLEHHKRQSELFNRGPGAGRDDSSLKGSMQGSSGVPSGGGQGRRPVIIPPGAPPASF